MKCGVHPDPELPQRALAIKIIPRGERSLEEARKVAQLDHPHIVPVYDVGHAGTWEYIISRFIDGPSLTELMRRRRLSKRHAVRILIDVADALSYAHSKKIIHRDVKPGNILTDKRGVNYLVDFGIAIMAGQPLDHGDALRGTLPYMSPEQIRGDSHLVDHRTDIYSLGVVLFELLTGQLPFSGDASTLRTQILQVDPPRPRTLDAKILPEVEAVCLQCLEKDSGRRFRTARSLANRLRRTQFMPTEFQVNKVEAVRRYLTATPNATDSAIAYALRTEGIQITTKRVHAIKNHIKVARQRDAISGFLKSNPEASNKEIAEALEKKGIRLTADRVAQIKTRMSAKASPQEGDGSLGSQL